MIVKLVTLLVIIILLLILVTSNKEGFGGPVTNKMYISPRDCLKVCDQYYNVCMDAYGGLDAGVCKDYYKDACVSSCLYNRYHSQ